MIRVDNVTDVLNLIDKYYKTLSLNDTAIRVEDSLNRITSYDIISKTDYPKTDISLVYGYACKDNLLHNASVYNPVSIHVSNEDYVDEFSCKYVSAFEAIPNGTTCVIKEEFVTKKENSISVNTPINKNDNILLKGSNIKKDDIILEKDTKINPVHISMLKALNEDSVIVKEKIKVGILSAYTNDKVSNSLIYKSELSNDNSLVIDYGKCNLQEDKDVYVKLDQMNKDSHIILISYNNKTQKDRLKNLILEKYKLFTNNINVIPIKDTLIGDINSTPVFLVNEENMNSIMIVKSLIQPFINRIYKIKQVNPYIISRCNEEIKSEFGYESYIPVILKEENNEYIFKEVKEQGNVPNILAFANGYIKINMEVIKINKNDKVKVYLF